MPARRAQYARMVKSNKKFTGDAVPLPPMSEIVQTIRKGSVAIVSLEGYSDVLRQSIVAGVMMSLMDARIDEKCPRFLSVVEEAHNFIPDRIDGTNAPSLPIIKRVATEGRKYGMGLVSISQRPSRLDATVLSQALLAVLEWNAEHDVHVFRIDSRLVPFASRPANSGAWREALAEDARVGAFAREHGARLSMRPGSTRCWTRRRSGCSKPRSPNSTATRPRWSFSATARKAALLGTASWEGAGRAAEAARIDVEEFSAFYEQVADLELDIMLEVKDKEQSLLACRERVKRMG